MIGVADIARRFGGIEQSLLERMLHHDFRLPSPARQGAPGFCQAHRLDIPRQCQSVNRPSELANQPVIHAECKGAAFDALQELGLLQWFDTRSSTTPFEQDPRPLLKLHGISGRVDYAWVAAVENWRELVGPEVSVEVDAMTKSNGR
jgi:hypothetical protein